MARDFDFIHGMMFGSGLDSLRGNVRGNAVVSASGRPPAAVDTGQTVSFSLQRVESEDDYESALSMSVEAAATFGLFGGSGSFSLSQKHAFHSYSKYLIVCIRVENPLLQIADPKLSETAFNLLDANDTDRFQQEFGDSFVLGISGGGLYYAVLEFTSTSQSDLDSVTAQLDAGEFGVFAAEAKFSDAIKKYSGQSRLQVTSNQIGGAAEGAKQQVSIDEIISKAQSFPTEALHNPRNISVVIQDYFAIDLPHHTPIQVENARDVLKHYAKIRAELQNELNDIEYIKLHPDQFQDPQNFDLTKLIRDTESALDSLTASASQCVEHVEQCQFRSQDLPTFALPIRKPVNLQTFVGVWKNVQGPDAAGSNERSGVIQRLEIFAADDAHVTITAIFEFPDSPPDTTTAAYDVSKKALEVELKNKGRLFTITNKLLIRVAPQATLQLIVINEEVIENTPTPTHVGTTQLMFDLQPS